MTEKLNRYSGQITGPRARGAAQAMLYAAGLSETDMTKAQVGICSVWLEGNPCNMHLNALGQQVRAGVREAALVGFRFNTAGVSDGISMGTAGMCYSLPSRDLIADSIETVVSAHWYDAVVTLPGCDKNLPGCAIAIGRLNRPALIVYGGTIRPGSLEGKPLDIVSAFQSYGAYLSGQIDDDTRRAIVRNSCPGAGACGGMYTANTMASALEAMGMMLPYSSSIPAEYPEKSAECRQAGATIRRLLEAEILPRDIMTRRAFENAITVITALGGSTNAVLHLIAMARAVEVELEPEDFQRIGERVPVLADLKPCWRPGSCTATAGPLPGERWPKTWQTPRSWRRSRKSSARRRIRFNPPATSGFCTATWRRRAPSPRFPERKANLSTVRPGCTTPKKPCCRHWRKAASAGAM